MNILKYAILILTAFSSGIVISGGVFAFISTIGVVTMLASKTKTEKYHKIYEDAILIGGIFGTSTLFINYYLPVGKVFVIFIALCTGVFYGCLAVSVAEVLNVIPIFVNKAKLKSSLSFLLTVMAIAKLFGSLYQYLAPNIYY